MIDYRFYGCRSTIYRCRGDISVYKKGDSHEIREGDLAEKAESVLDEVPFDTELGKQLAADARRVAKGELTREQFHKKHHEAVMREFGRDERNSKPEGFDDE